MFILFLPDVLKLFFFFFFFKGTIIESSVNTIKNLFIPLILCCIILNHLDEDVSITTHSEQQMAPLKKKKKKKKKLPFECHFRAPVQGLERGRCSDLWETQWQKLAKLSED